MSKEIDDIVTQEFELLKNQHPFYNSLEWTIYFPYQSIKTLRRNVSIYKKENGEKTSESYPRFILECKSQRLLQTNEDAHHINNFEFDDRLENLEIINKHKHRSEHKTKLPEYFTCLGCGIIFSAEGRKLTKIKIKLALNLNNLYCNLECYRKNKISGGNQYGKFNV